ncbi:hypothetical protein [Azospirillum palustre]
MIRGRDAFSNGPSRMGCRYRVCRLLSRLAAARLPRSPLGSPPASTPP